MIISTMKRVIVAIVTILIAHASMGQKYFEGKVVYQNSTKGFGSNSIAEELYYRSDGSYVYLAKGQSMKLIYLADKHTTYTISQLNGKTTIMFDSTTASSSTIIERIYLDTDTVENRECIKVKGSIKSGKIRMNITSWIDTNVCVLNTSSPTGKGLEVKNITSMNRQTISMQAVKKLISIEAMPVDDTLFELPTEEGIKWIDMGRIEDSGTNSADSLTNEFAWIMEDNSADKTEYIIETTESSFDSDIKSGIVLVDFWAKWCAPCQLLTPKMELVAQKHLNDVKVLKVDVDKCKSLAKKYDAKFIPMVVVMKDGNEIGRLVGADFQNTDDVIWEKINSIIKTSLLESN